MQASKHNTDPARDTDTDTATERAIRKILCIKTKQVNEWTNDRTNEQMNE